MRRRLAVLGVVATGLGLAPAAAAEHWPVAGGTASRSGSSSTAPAQTPIAGAWAAADGRVRTPLVITGGGGPDVQRVAYGTHDGRVHLRVVGTGAPVGPPEGIDIDNGSVENDGAVFGTAGAVGFADTSTEDRLGQLLVVHNDDIGVPKVFVARIRLDTGAIVNQDIVPSGAADCTTESSPLLTPPAAGGRLLYFTMLCSGGLSRYLVRVPLQGDATSPDATIGPAGFALVPDATDVASPALVVLDDAGGAPRYHVAVPRAGGVWFFRADDPLRASADGTAHPPAITASLAAADERAMTPVAPSTADGQVAGGDTSGWSEAVPALYVAAAAAGATKVYRLVQTGAGQALRVDQAVALPDSGVPAPAAALDETVTAAGLSAGGRLLVTHARNATLLRTSDLFELRRLAGAALPPGHGFARTTAAISGGYAYLTRDGAADVVPEQLVLQLDELAPLSPPAFARSEDGVPGLATGQPALSRANIVLGTAAGAFGYRGRDVVGPSVTLVAPATDSGLSGTVTLQARATDGVGVEAVSFRLAADGGTSRLLGRVTERDGSTFSMPFPTASVSNGTYWLEAVAADAAGNSASSERRRVRILNPGATGGLPSGACANPLTGSLTGDRIVGTAAGDRILGGGGDDRLDGAGGHDCVLGEAGDDVLAGGTGDDLLEGAAGDDVLAGGSGRNRSDGGAGADVIRGGAGAEVLSGRGGRDTILGGHGRDRLSGGGGRDLLKGEGGDDVLAGGAGRNRLVGGAGRDVISAVNGRRDVISCGKGRDRVSADRADRVSRSCERVTRRRHRS